MASDSLILRLRYTGERQSAFAQLSGDYNPIHADAVTARRTLVGGQVVHGIHHVLAGLEALTAEQTRKGGLIGGIAGFSAQFLKPVLLDETVEFYESSASENEVRVAVRIGSEVMCQLSFQLRKGRTKDNTQFTPLLRESPQALTFDQAQGLHGKLPLGLDVPLARESFPGVIAAVGTTGLAEILALTRLVGMHCPGLHSLFSQAICRWDGKGEAGMLAYDVEEMDDRFSRIVIGVKGPRLQGRLTAFFRPKPGQQPRMEEVAQSVEAAEFASSRALIVGGSRGLGEITAKLIAAGGGMPIITYYQGGTDAEQLANAIRTWGGRCELIRFDVLQIGSELPEIFSGSEAPRTLYYFATPKIFTTRRGFLGHETLASHINFYVTAFGRLLESIPARAGRKLRIFYPSSVAVIENMREMAEYAIAKRAGEELCAFYNRYSKTVEISVERLPRIHTDQTQTLLPIPAEAALSVMLPIVRRMEPGHDLSVTR